MVSESSEINQIYYAMCLIRHKADISSIRLSGQLFSSFTAGERDGTLQIIEEIQGFEGMQIHSFSDSKANNYLLLLSTMIQESTKRELINAGLNIEQGEKVLDKLRHDTELEDQPSSTNAGSFKIGQKVIYPNHGIGTIEQIEQKQIGATSLSFYTIRLAANNSIILIPVATANEVGLRFPISSSKIESLLKNLSEDFKASSDDLNERFKGFSEKMRSGDLYEVADVLKSLTYLSHIKPLPFREQRMLERARYLVISELAAVCRQPESSIEPRVEQALARACAKHKRQTGSLFSKDEMSERSA